MAEQAVLFDLDGTLADTAPDLADALNRLRREEGKRPIPLARVRPFASAGARGLLRAGFGVGPGDAEYEALRAAFLEHYRARTCVKTKLFPGVRPLLSALRARAIPWGIVTNKLQRFTDRIVARLGLAPDCVVCGDTTPHTKPHPAPLLAAAERLGVAATRCWYLGDDLRDMQAARAAAMRPVAVLWGYHHPEGGDPVSWQADALIERPADLLALLERGA